MWGWKRSGFTQLLLELNSIAKGLHGWVEVQRNRNLMLATMEQHTERRHKESQAVSKAVARAAIGTADAPAILDGSAGWYTLSLNDYQVANLRATIQAIGYPAESVEPRDRGSANPLRALNTGDWLGEIYNLLPDINCSPNESPFVLRRHVESDASGVVVAYVPCDEMLMSGRRCVKPTGHKDPALAPSGKDHEGSLRQYHIELRESRRPPSSRRAAPKDESRLTLSHPAAQEALRAIAEVETCPPGPDAGPIPDERKVPPYCPKCGGLHVVLCPGCRHPSHDGACTAQENTCPCVTEVKVRGTD